MGAHTLINKRTGNDIWKNLYELPLIETENEVPEQKFQRTQVTAGMSDGIKIEIKKGVTVQDKIRGAEKKDK